MPLECVPIAAFAGPFLKRRLIGRLQRGVVFRADSGGHSQPPRPLTFVLVMFLCRKRSRQEERNVSMDEFRRRADECRCLAAAARNAGDRNFWLGRVERWQALERQNARLRANPSPGHRFGGSPKPQAIDGLGLRQ